MYAEIAVHNRKTEFSLNYGSTILTTHQNYRHAQ